MFGPSTWRPARLGLKAAALLLGAGAIGMAGPPPLPWTCSSSASEPFSQVDGQHWPGRADPFFNDPAFPRWAPHRFPNPFTTRPSRVDAVAGRPQSVAIPAKHPPLRPSLNTSNRRAIPGFLEAGGYSLNCPHLWAESSFRWLAKGLRHQGQEAVGDFGRAACAPISSSMASRIGQNRCRPRSQRA